jgi:uncharacterized protein YbbC (DUF1343 family)
MRSHGWYSWVLFGLLGAAAVCARPAAVRPGIDVLLADSSQLVRGRRIGLLTNQTGVDREGRDDLSRLRDAGITVTALFSPEHGYRGGLDVENIESAVDSATGLPVFSLYGAVLEPTPTMLSRVDAVVVDLQDIGTRTYTYVSTALRTLRAATRAGVAVIVLDRPDPIGGTMVQGPVLDTAYASFIGMLPVPLRHGMTFGELLRFGNDVLGIHGALTVVPVAGWRRDAWFDATGLPWMRPSPNMPDLESATHYPGLVLFESTNLSVGRGTPIAFQIVAAPWLDARRAAADLVGTPGVAVRDTVVDPVMPTDHKYGGMRLPALRFAVTDRRTYDPVRLAARLLATVIRLHRDSLRIDSAGFDQRAGTDRLRRAIVAGVSPDSVTAGWRAALDRFAVTRRRYLLY